MPRRAARVDANQAEIVKALRLMGFLVLLLHQVGRGCPDILIAKHGRMMLVEIKTLEAYRRKQHGLTGDEKTFHELWKDTPLIIGYDIEQIVEAFDKVAF